MILFLDTSALVKLYIAEPGARRRREDLLTADEYQLVIDSFEADWGTTIQVPVSDDVLALVPELCRGHPLRGADALQLAAALMICRQEVEVHFATSDRQLLGVAEAEGLTVFDPAV